MGVLPPYMHSQAVLWGVGWETLWALVGHLAVVGLYVWEQIGLEWGCVAALCATPARTFNLLHLALYHLLVPWWFKQLYKSWYFDKFIWLLKKLSISVVLVQMRPEGISAGNKLLTELTIISTWNMLALYVLVQMSSIHGCVVAVSADPGTVDLHYFGLD